jgi:hypothetical protein
MPGRRTIASLAILLALAPFVSKASGPDPKQVYVESISYGGTGCPQGTVGQSLSDDRSQLTLIFDSYVASTGPAVPITESRKACQLNINLHVPQGWSYSIGDITYRGYAQLARGQVGQQISTYYFAGSSTQARFSKPITGPTAQDYTVGDHLGLDALVWSACNAVVPLNVKSAVQINGPVNVPGQLTNDSTDGKMKTLLGLQWRQC